MGLIRAFHIPACAKVLCRHSAITSGPTLLLFIAAKKGQRLCLYYSFQSHHSLSTVHCTAPLGLSVQLEEGKAHPLGVWGEEILRIFEYQCWISCRQWMLTPRWFFFSKTDLESTYVKASLQRCPDAHLNPKWGDKGPVSHQGFVLIVVIWYSEVLYIFLRLIC